MISLMSSVVQSSQNVFPLQKCVILQNLFERSARAKQLENVGNSHTLTANARTPSALARFHGDSLESL